MRLKKRHIVLIVILALGIIGGIAGSNGDEDSGKDPEASDQGKDDTKKEEEKDPTYKIGDTINVGDVAYLVSDTEVVDSIGTDLLNKKAQNKFLVVTITVKNNGDKALVVADDFFHLKIGDKEYKADSGAGMYQADSTILLKEINPDASLSGKIVFDVAQETIDAPELQLQVQTGAWGTEKGLINLH